MDTADKCGASTGRYDTGRQEELSVSMRIPIRIELEALNSRVIELFERSLRKHSVIEECYAVAGNTDYLLFVSVKEIQEFEAIHRNVLSKLPGVKKIKAEFPLRRVLPI
ncbi:Lrp/AsnC ligand binding domain-containing protein [Mesorhizobium onobrychidis]|uniref:Lrp/AsnC ligand binding domain-containing protein n=1 Tax=Mesorhizobium onobrychidis TaxID=2775404 RepID=A0ABY5QV98_9HYPH|nr:Lrp/AsnC ligand binding domain-containing protein [Mesorhizobium onobrychidis]UVC15140.1 Lrp/AsnC ligand binding domain-containing protein [Mesorhizobium onobrychidis]